MKKTIATSGSNALVLLPKAPQKRKSKPLPKPGMFTTTMTVRSNLRSHAAFLRRFARNIAWIGLGVVTMLCLLNAYAKDLAASMLEGSMIDAFCGWLPIVICAVVYLVGCACFAAIAVLNNMADALLEDSKRLTKG